MELKADFQQFRIKGSKKKSISICISVNESLHLI